MSTSIDIDRLFLLVCIPIRLLLAFIVYYYPRHIQYFGLIGLVIALGFAYFSVVPRETGAFGQPAWWAPYRPIHSFLFFLFFILAVNKNKYAWLVLFIDAMLGLFLYK
jgi:hypothetical protein